MGKCKYNNLTIVVQGPQKKNSESVRGIQDYLKFGRVVISHWTDDEVSLAHLNTNLVKVVSSKPPELRGRFNRGHLYQQGVSTLNGLRECKTKYAIKIRSDERYSNLSPIMERLLRDDGKVVTNNIFFRGYNIFHPSDHLMGGKTKTLIDGFRLLLQFLDTGTTDGILEGRTGVISNEQAICGSIVRAMGHPTKASLAAKVMRKTFDVVPVSQLGDVVWCLGEQRNHNTHPPLSIDSMSEIKYG